MRVTRAIELAAGILKAGKSKVYVEQGEETRERIKTAITKEDVRSLIKERLIRKRKDPAQSRGAARILAGKKSKGRKRGMGKRKGTRNVRRESKQDWMKRVRAQRRILREMKEKYPEAVEALGYRTLYARIKGNYFKGKKYVEKLVESQARQQGQVKE